MTDASPRGSWRAQGKRSRWPCLIAPLIPIVVLAGCGSASRSRQPQQPTPLAASAASVNGAWAVAHVGAPYGEESFWELLWRAPHGTRWKLITPPGVQDNGGLSIATAPTSVVAGFIVSNNLRFSPLASSYDEGRTWTPNVLPAALVAGPDSLAETAKGTILALLAHGSGEVVAQSTASGGSSPLVSAGTLARTASHCTLLALTALELAPHQQPTVGGACAQPGVVGVYTYESGRWLATAPQLPKSLASDGAQLLRLTRAGSSTLALIDAHAGTRETLIAAWGDDGGARWSESRSLALEGGEHPIGTGVGPGGQTLVLAKSPRGERLWICEAASGSWRTLPAPPAGTTTVVFRGDSEIEALQTRKAALVAWQLAHNRRRWHQGDAVHVTF